jgi:hypothetical protein
MVKVTELFTPVPPTVDPTSPLLTSDPAMLLPVSVCVSDVPTTAPAGAATLEVAPVEVVTVTRPVDNPPGNKNPLVAAECKSRIADAPPVNVCVANVKSAPMSLTAVVDEA